jgi:DNA-binding NarL/FixJ family response regulator
MPISILLADDHPVTLRGLRALLESEGDFSILGVATDGIDTVHQAELLKPDVLILDLVMPGLAGLEVLQILHKTAPSVRIVVLSMYGSTAFVAKALENGAFGFVLKSCTENNLVRAVRDVAAGGHFLSPPVTEIAIANYIELCKAHPSNPHAALSPRQREVLQLTAEGKTSSEISERLKISPRTVENHRSAVMQKLGLRNHTDLIRHAIRHGMIPPDE